MFDLANDGVAACGLDVITGILGSDPRPGDVLRLNRDEHYRVVKELHRTFERWTPPSRSPGQYRAILELPDPFADPRPIRFSSAALFAHQVVLRDPLDSWLREWEQNGVDRRSVSLAALDDAIIQALPLRPMVEQGVLVLAPEPRTVRGEHPIEGFLESRDGAKFEATRDVEELAIPAFEAEAAALRSDPDFAEAVLGYPVGRDWELAASGGTDDLDEDLDWRMRGEPGPTDEESGQVHIAALDFAWRSEYARAADGSLLPINRVENALINAVLNSVGEMTAVTTTTLLHGTGIAHLSNLSPKDVLGIRSEVDAYRKWRDWLEKVSATAMLADDRRIGEAQELFDDAVNREIAAALQEATRKESLLRYAEREGAVTVARIGIKGLLGLPLIGDAGGAAIRIAMAAFRPRAEAHRAVLVRLVDGRNRLRQQIS